MLFATGVALASVAALSAQGAGKVDYLTDIKPVLKARCYACHGALKQNNGLRLDTAAAIRKGGKHGAAVSPRKPDASHLLQRVTATDLSERMPPEGEPLKPEQIAALRAWIAAGAPVPKDEQGESDPRDHWAFKPLAKVTVPKIGNQKSEIANPIDAFLEAARRKHKLTAQPPAEKSIWLRRVHLDLTGLPPKLEEMRAFEADHSPGARTAVVERLLASPHYGERWGRHFMDLWRYSDWYGLDAQLRNSQKHLWHWRDWIIESLNADKGYDRMIVEMLAGDEIAPTDHATLRATGFLARNYYLFNRTTWLDDTIEHTGKAFLGLTLNCVKCHDHKYDPISHADYYAMRAIFEPHHVRLDELPGESDLERNGLPRSYDLHLDRPTYIHLKGDEKQPDTNRVIAAAIPFALAFRPLEIQPVKLPPMAHQPALQSFVLSNHLQVAEKAIAAAQAALDKAKTAGKPAEIKLAELNLRAAELKPATLKTAGEADRARSEAKDSAKTKELAKQAALAEAKWKLAQAEAEVAKVELELASAAESKKAEAEKKMKAAQETLAKARKTVETPGETYTSLRGTLKALEGPDETAEHRLLPYPDASTGRRTALARWIADRQNPLTARVLVNHVWLRHFGQPLVASVADFGRHGTPPTHPELLDWLAVEFMEHDWSLKHLHRLMVLSEAYAMTSSAAGARPATLKADGENKFYWRMNPQRMDAQTVRDSLLHLAGTLDLKLGGPTIDPKKEDTVMRRSLYFTHSRDDEHKFLEMFNNASILECYRREESVLPQQALALANSKLPLNAAAKLAERIERENAAQTDADFIATAFETVLATRPTSEEQAVCLAALERLKRSVSEGRDTNAVTTTARARFLHALLNHNDYLTVR
jgi:mono/diheme cytochrome c family protein